MISHTSFTAPIRQIARILTVLCVCLLLTSVPASAARMDSVDVNGSDVAYEAQFKAYTEAASDDDAMVCQFTVANPTAGKTGALCRIVLPQSQNVYLYMDDGDLAVMRYDGSAYKKFSADYQLKRDFTYTLCVFRDGLVLFDGIHCYTYSGNLYGFTDVIAGWSDDSNVFSTSLTKHVSVTESNGKKTEPEDEPASLATTEVPASNPYPPIWVVLALLLGLSSNLLALTAVHSSNVALRAVRRGIPYANMPRRSASAPKQTRPARQPTRKPQAASQQAVKKQQTVKRPAAKAPAASAPARRPAAQKPAEKKKPILFFPDEPKKNVPAKPPAAQPAVSRLSQPFDLYLDGLWRAHTDKMMPYHFGNAGLGYFTFSPGTDLSREMFVQIGGEAYIWLNPVRFHADSAEHGVLLRISEIAGIGMAFNFYHADTGKREIAVSYDVKMVSFRPARAQITHQALELLERGMIMFEPAE